MRSARRGRHPTRYTPAVTRIAHLADVHLGLRHLSVTDETGVNRREADGYAVFAETIERLVQLHPDVCVIAGDLYEKTTPPVRAQDAAFTGMRRLRAAGIEVMVIGGNHDQAESPATMNALELLGSHADVHVALDYEHHDLAGVRFHCLPYRRVTRMISGRAPTPDFDFAPGPNVLVAHGYVPGPSIERIPDPALIGRSLTYDEHRFDLVCLGHIHTHAQLDEEGRLFYPGRLERFNWDEVAEEPGFWLHTLDADGLRSESVPVAGFSTTYPRPMRALHLPCAGLGLDAVREASLSLLDEQPPGSIIALALDEVVDEVRHSQLRDTLVEHFLARGGISLNVSYRTADVIELLDAELSATPEQLSEAWLAYALDQEREDLATLGAEILHEAGEAP